MAKLSEDTATQGNFIFVFTVVTVVFVSLYPRPQEDLGTDRFSSGSSGIHGSFIRPPNTRSVPSKQ